MNLKERLKTLNERIFSSQENRQTSHENPYLRGAEGRKEWNDRYHNMAAAIKNWQLAFLAAMGMAVVLTIVVATIASQSKVQPFVVETNHGMPYAVKAMTTLSPHDDKLVNFAINQFIINAKSVITDQKAQTTMLDKVYAYSADNTLAVLHDFYNASNPFETAKQTTVSVSIVNAMPLSQNTWQITWDETKRNAQSGEVVNVTRWMANVTYRFGEINTKFINENPFGLYITDVSWSQSHSTVS